ncbi:FAD-dependent oxidoreductase, partial [Armatimonas sp.]|uniref:FAD-dependent oxidoreductase n=1 Tax=Armatimonas sp. TaxID=1872638 RepID=UPI003750C918
MISNNRSSLRTLIVGAGMGGLRTAESLRRYKYPGQIHILGSESHMPYNRPPLSKALLAQDQDFTQVSFPIRSDDLNAEFTLGDSVEQLSLEQRSVTLRSEKKIEFDFLVAATGLRSRKLAYPNNLQSGRFALRTFDDA